MGRDPLQPQNPPVEEPGKPYPVERPPEPAPNEDLPPVDPLSPDLPKIKPLKILDPFLRFGDRFDHWVVGTQFDPSRLHHALWTTTDYFKDRKKARIWRAF